MKGFIIRVCAYHGAPVIVDGVPTRAGYYHDVPVLGANVINDPHGDVVKDLDSEAPSDYTLLNLVEDFEDEYGCKVNFDDREGRREPGDDAEVFEFDVFEPAWPNEDEAKDVIDDLVERLTDWVAGHPTGR